ncbi:MAG: glycosyltransferase [Planctomycetota bacterium]
MTGGPPVLGIDYTAGPGHAPGVGRYVRELVRALVRLDDAATRPLVLVEVGRGPRPMEGAPLGLVGATAVRRRRLRVPRRVVRALPGMSLAVAGGCRLFHRVAPDAPPVGATPFTLAVAELPRTGTAAGHAFADAASRAKATIVFSTDARDRVLATTDAAAARVHVAPVGTDHWERDLEAPPPRRPTRDVLVLGAIRSARRPLQALRGFEALRANGARARLLLVGRPGDSAAPFREALARSPVRGDVRWIETPDEARMPGCVAGATALLHLADDEATPVTPLEAMRHGLPVVASPLPAFREALGDDGLWVDADDAAAVGAALREALDAGEHAPRRKALAVRARPYTWRACAEAHVQAWDPILRVPDHAVPGRAGGQR